MREQQERFREELRQQQITFLQQQLEYMAAYNAQAQQAINVSVFEREMCPWAISKYFGD
jgi:hypothetical protein